MGNNSSKVIAGIVTYNPEIARLKSNLESVRLQIEKIIVIDNGSGNVEEIEELINGINSNIELVKWEKNKGIAFALKVIMDYSKKEQAEWVLTLDQDSIVQEGLIAEYLKYANQQECSNVGMFTCLIKDRNFSDPKHEVQRGNLQKVDCCITSGAFCSVEKYKHINGYDVSFFIDCVDFDICYQLRDAGFDICRINYLGLIHEVGHGENRHFFLKKIVIYHHNEKRIYTLSRNMMYLWRKHPKIFGVHRLIKKYLALFTRIVVYEDHKRAKLRAFQKGVNDALKNL